MTGLTNRIALGATGNPWSLGFRKKDAVINGALSLGSVTYALNVSRDLFLPTDHFKRPQSPPSSDLKALVSSMQPLPSLLFKGKSDIPDIWELDDFGAGDPANENTSTPLHEAIRANDGDAIKNQLLLPEGVASLNHFNEKGYTPLHLASLKMNSSTLETLLRHIKAFSIPINVDLPDANTNTPALLAAADGNVATLKLLRKAGANFLKSNQEGQTPLHWAAEYSKRNAVKYLLNVGVNPNIENAFGQTPLHLACNFKGMALDVSDLVEVLLNKGADPSWKDGGGQTPLHYAAHSGNENLVKLLLKYGAAVDVQDFMGDSPLHQAADKAHHKVVKALVEAGADVNRFNRYGSTPLTQAVLSGKAMTVYELLQGGADPFLSGEAFPGAPAFTPFQGLVVSENVHLLDVFFHSVFQNKSFQQHPLLKALNALHQMVQQPQELEKWAQVFGEQMPYIMDQSTGQDIGTLFKYLEDGFDHRLFPKNYHPNEAELMLLLRHPDLIDRKNMELLSPLTTGLTSITRFIEKDIELTDSMVKAWGDIGLLTHGFRFWKFDTMGAEKSLLAAFGFQPLPANRPLDDVFGKGFVFEDPESKILLEMRRGYMLATHPDHGTLVVRNSSTIFGRDLLKHPAYYLPVELSKTNLLTFDPRNIKEDWHILNREVYTSEKQRNGMIALSEGLMGLKENYRRFKLDTEAFEGYGAQRKFVGQFSPGLPKMVDALIYFQELSQSTGKPLPDLAFVNPDYPIYEPYGRFSLTPQRLQELKDFVKGHWSESKYPNSAWIQFLNEYGVSNRGELVMIDPVTPG